MRANRWTRRHFLAACGLAPLALAGCGKSSDRDKDAKAVFRDLQLIGLAFHNHQSSYGRLPTPGPTVMPATGGNLARNGTPWRIALLPYIEREDLYNAIENGKFGREYWTSPELAKQGVATYAAGPGAEAGLTRYRVFVGGGAAFEPDQNLSLHDFADGTQSTLLAVEAEEAVPWTSTRELEYDPKKPLPKLGHPSRDGFLGLMAGGSVNYFPKDLDEQMLRALITRIGGEPLPNLLPER
jgi:hypothetical protein